MNINNINYADAWGGITLADGRSVCPDGKGGLGVRASEPTADIQAEGCVNPLLARDSHKEETDA